MVELVYKYDEKSYCECRIDDDISDTHFSYSVPTKRKIGM